MFPAAQDDAPGAWPTMRREIRGPILICTRRGFTLAEAMLAATILAIATAAASLPFAAGVQQTMEAARLENAAALGQSLMEEILARPYLEPGTRTVSPGPDSGESNRTLFDNIDDFDGFSESVTGPRDYQNQPITDTSLAGLWRDAAVQITTFPGQAANDVNSLARVTVRVWDGNTVLVKLVRIAARED
jgi:prepilin-type N-terminal cleavage/methylation domain-containing protein